MKFVLEPVMIRLTVWPAFAALGLTEVMVCANDKVGKQVVRNRIPKMITQDFCQAFFIVIVVGIVL